MRKLAALAAVAAALSVSACKKTAPGEYEVQQPVIGTQTDTVHTPSVTVGTESTTVSVPKLEVKRDSATMKVPTVQVNSPSTNAAKSKKKY